MNMRDPTSPPAFKQYSSWFSEYSAVQSRVDSDKNKEQRSKPRQGPKENPLVGIALCFFFAINSWNKKCWLVAISLSYEEKIQAHVERQGSSLRLISLVRPALTGHRRCACPRDSGLHVSASVLTPCRQMADSCWPLFIFPHEASSADRPPSRRVVTPHRTLPSSSAA